jgi:hypothetical protein
MGNRFNKRWIGTRIKHQMGPVSIKMYDKFNLILRTLAPHCVPWHRPPGQVWCNAGVETTVNNVAFFKHYRQVLHRDGSTTMGWAPMKKTIHSLPALRELLSAANQRYLKFISSIATPQVGVEQLQRLAETKTEDQHRHKGFNLFSEEDICLLRTQYLSHKSASQVTRLLKRLRVHGVIKKIG